MSKKQIIESEVLFWCKGGSAGRLGSQDRRRKLEFFPVLIAICWTVKTTASVIFCRQFLFCFFRLLFLCYSSKPLVRLLPLPVTNLSQKSAIPLINVTQARLNRARLNAQASATVQRLMNTLKGVDKRKKGRYLTKKKAFRERGKF